MKNLATAQSPTILIVDDSVDSRSFCEWMAEMFNVKVIQARNVDEALVILGEGVKPAVVLLDLIMPGLRPEALVQRIKNDETLTATKVVIMSALREVGKRAKEMGADASMRKPFTMPRFVNVLGLASLGHRTA